MSEHPWGVRMPAWLLLNQFADVVRAGFGVAPILVGSALRTKAPADIDVRVVLADEEFVRFVGPIGECNVLGTRWASLSMAYAALGKQMTDRPIDFQIQCKGAALAYKDEPSIVLGVGTRR